MTRMKVMRGVGAAWAAAAVLALMATLGVGPAAAGPLLDPETAAPAGVTMPIDVNAAAEEQLMLLPGIGPAKARAIVTYRAKRRFRVVNDLLRVKGIGPGILKRIRPFVTVDADDALAPTAGAKAAATAAVKSGPAATKSGLR